MWAQVYFHIKRSLLSRDFLNRLKSCISNHIYDGDTSLDLRRAKLNFFCITRRFNLPNIKSTKKIPRAPDVNWCLSIGDSLFWLKFFKIMWAQVYVHIKRSLLAPDFLNRLKPCISNHIYDGDVSVDLRRSKLKSFCITKRFNPF